MKLNSIFLLCIFIISIFVNILKFSKQETTTTPNITPNDYYFYLPMNKNFDILGSKPFTKDKLLNYGPKLSKDRHGNQKSYQFYKNFIETKLISFPDPSQLISISLWFKTDSYSNTYSNLLYLQDTTNLYFRIFINTNVIKVIQKGYSTKELQTTTNVSDKKWHNVIFINDKTDRKIYLDGNLVLKEKITNSLYSFINGYMKIGGESNSNFFNGKIDDVVFYEKALSDSEIRSLYGGAGGIGLVWDWGVFWTVISIVFGGPLVLICCCCCCTIGIAGLIVCVGIFKE